MHVLLFVVVRRASAPLLFGHDDTCGMQESYSGLSNKTRTFLKLVALKYPSLEYIVKVDDDVYLLPDRLMMAADQWREMGAE